jgi:hypothetical protein
MPQEPTDPPSPKDQICGVGRCGGGYDCDILKEKPMYLYRIWSGLCVGCLWAQRGDA